MKWQTVYVFISSTFNDMHAERDLLVKHVFPELRLWCAKRKLKLVDVDLRWGVSAADAQENKRVVEVCMKNIDKCRPFFLCFLGQRRGWVPEKADISPETLELFPELSKYIGNASVTELEILHALMHPLSTDALPVEHARFYFRQKHYLKQITTTEHKTLFCPKTGFFSKGDSTFEHFKREIRKNFPVMEYTANWNKEKPSPELQGSLSQGRLENFRVANNTLEQDVLLWLKKEITEEFPEHQEIATSTSALDIELDHQDTQLFQALDGYISRPVEEQALFDIIHQNSTCPILLLADAGCGKTSLLAQTIHKLSATQKVYYRFVGTTPHTFKKDALANSLVQEWIRDGLLSEDDVKYSANEMSLVFANLLQKAWKKNPFILILDGLDQLNDDLDAHFLPPQVPKECALIFSLRSDADWIPEKNVLVHSLGLMTKREDKLQMVKEYLGTFLKDIDEEQQEILLSMKGSGNPLYMKIVLNELRQHGSFDTLFEIFDKNYGSTPLEAFEQVILRIKKQLIDQGYSEFLAQLFFGCLACTQEGLDSNIFYNAFKRLTHADVDHLSSDDVNDIIYGLARELEPFLILDGNKLLLRYDSLRRAFYELFPNYDTVIHTVLSIAFADSALQKDYPRYMECAMYHIRKATKDFTYNFFQCMPISLWCIQHNGAQLLAETLHTLAYDRRITEFELPAQIVSKACSRLDTNPETLYMELRRYGNLEHPLISTMLEYEDSTNVPSYLEPITSPDVYALIQNEYALPNRGLYAFNYTEPYYVQYTHLESLPIIKIIDRRTSKLVNILHLEPDKDFYDTTNIAVDEQLLYVCCVNRNTFKYVKCYSLPDLTLVSEYDTPQMLPTGPRELCAFNNQLYSVCVESFEDDTNSEGKEKISLICVTTGKTLYSAYTKETCNFQFLGKYLIYRDPGPGSWFIIRTEDGKLLVKEQFLGHDTVKRISMYTGGGNLRASLGKTLVVWLSGVGLENGKDTITRDIRNYKILENGDLELIAQSKDLDVSISCVNVLSTGHIIVESKGILCVIDESLHVLGYMDVKDTIQGSKDWSGKIQLVGKDCLLVFYENKIQTLSFQTILENLVPNPIKVSYTKCDAAVRNGWLYVFGPKITRTNFVTCEKETAPGESGIIERICPWNIDDHFCCTSTAYNGFHFTQHDLDMIDEPNRCKLETLEGFVLLHAFHYINKNDELKPSFVAAEPKAYYHTYKDEEKAFVHCHLLTPHPLQSKQEPYFWNTKDLNIELLYDKIHNFRVETVCTNHDAFIVLPNVYKNKNELAIYVIQASTGNVIFEHSIPSPITPLSLDKIHCYSKGLILSYQKGDSYFFGHLDLEAKRFITDTSGRRALETPIRDNYVYLCKRGSLNIDIYSLIEHKIIKSFTLSDRNSFLVRQIMRVKDYLIVQTFNSDILEVYDFKTGKKLFEQRMEQIVDNLYLDPESQHFAMLDSNQRIHIWKIKE